MTAMRTPRGERLPLTFGVESGVSALASRSTFGGEGGVSALASRSYWCAYHKEQIEPYTVVGMTKQGQRCSDPNLSVDLLSGFR